MEVQKRLSQCIVFIIYERFSGKKKDEWIALNLHGERLELLKQLKKKKFHLGTSPGGLVVKVLPSNAAVMQVQRLSWGAKTPHISWP